MQERALTFRKAVATLFSVLLLVSCTATKDASGKPRIYPALSEPEHKPIFHNDHIDAYQVRLSEGEGSFYHLHSRDQLGISMRSFVSANQVLGTQEKIGRSTGGSISYIPHTAMGGTTHRVRALEGEMWVIGIEFAQPAPQGAKMLTAAPNEEQLEFPQGRATRVAIAPGQKIEIKGDLLLAMNAGALQAKAPEQSWAFEGGNLKWIGDVATGYTNGGNETAQLLVLDLN